MKKTLFLLLFCLNLVAVAQTPNYTKDSQRIYLDSPIQHGGTTEWTMKKASEITTSAEQLSQPDYSTQGWLSAIVPGTVLNSLVYHGIYPDPYHGINNKKEQHLIPDLADTGRDFYTYWFRSEFLIPESFQGKTIWMEVEGINYRAEIWVNGHLVSHMNGMFKPDVINLTDVVKAGEKSALAIKVFPVDVPGTTMPKSWGATGEWHNGGDGNIGLNTTMLMSVGWDFTFNDGIRDRNTGIWKSISLFTTKDIRVKDPFVKSALNATYDRAQETISVDVENTTHNTKECTVKGEISGTGIQFEKKIKVVRGMTETVTFTPEEFKQLIIDQPRLWWPIHKGEQHLYELKVVAEVDGVACDSLKTRFGIREIVSNQNTPDGSRQFYVNGKKLFVHGTNWIPEAMLKSNDWRTYMELKYTQQSGINFIRFWGGGIAESDYFYQLCDEMGFLVWQEFWMTGDTKHPHDGSLYLSNMEATVKRIRNHPSIAYYVSSNESTEMPGAKELIHRLDGTRGYQMASEVDGIHDGSPYKQVNPMQHYENTASDRGSRIDGFNPEYGAPTLPLVSSLRKMMDEKDLWPINKEVWDYLDGGGFHLMSTLYTDMTNAYGASSSIEEFARKAQYVGAMNSKSIWEAWNEQKLHYGDRYASGLLFWYHNCPVPQVCGRMWDYYLVPTSSLYYTKNALEPLHPQFDYLTNTVSVVNNLYQSFQDMTVQADVFDFQSKKVWSHKDKVNLPEDGVANDVFKIDFPASISQVHFIKLYLYNKQGEKVGENFYWRSKDQYEGRTTLTGPCTSGFEQLGSMPAVKLTTKLMKTEKLAGHDKLTVKVKNSSKKIAFFNQLALINADGEMNNQCFWSDNFFSLLPGEEKIIQIEVPEKMCSTSYHIQQIW